MGVTWRDPKWSYYSGNKWHHVINCFMQFVWHFHCNNYNDHSYNILIYTIWINSRIDSTLKLVHINNFYSRQKWQATVDELLQSKEIFLNTDNNALWLRLTFQKRQIQLDISNIPIAQYRKTVSELRDLYCISRMWTCGPATVIRQLVMLEMGICIHLLVLYFVMINTAYFYMRQPKKNTEILLTALFFSQNWFILLLHAGDESSQLVSFTLEPVSGDQPVLRNRDRNIC